MTVRALKLLSAAIAAIGVLAGLALAQPQTANPSPGAFVPTTRELWSGAWSTGATQDRPTWFWDFRNGALPAGSTFTRASGRTCVNSSGVIVLLASNVPCIDHDPLTLQPLGYLAEMQSTNAIPRSQALTGSGWAATASTVTDNAQAAPDGTTTAATITESATTATHSVEFSTVSIVSGSVYGLSSFAKNVSGSRWLILNVGGAAYCYFNPSTGAIGTVGTAMSSAVARSLPNGWWRFSCLFTASSTVSTDVRLVMAAANAAANYPSYAGDGTSSIALWGVQFETAGVGVTSYIPTAGAPATRSQDVLTMPLSAMPGWDGASGGVLVATFRLNTIVPSIPGFNQNPVYLYKTDHNNALHIKAQDGGGGRAKFYMTSGGVVQGGVLDLGAVPAIGTRSRMAGSWGTDRVAGSLNGVAAVPVSGAFSLPVGPMDTIDFGRYTGHALNGTLESVAYYKGRPPNALVQQVTR